MSHGRRVDLEDPSAYVRAKLSVYLACSLSSDENRVFKDEVLSTTAGIFAEAGFDVYNPALHTPPGSPHTSSEVYFEDLFHPINSDLIFFLRLGRSHGMGIEAQLAADVLLPWGDARLSDNSYDLSPLLAGLSSAPGIWRGTIYANNPNQFYALLAKALRDESRLTRLQEARHARDHAHEIIRTACFGYHIRVRRLIFRLSTADLGKLVGIDPTWIEAIESDSRFVSKLTVLQFARLCDTLEMTFASPASAPTLSFPKFTAPTGVAPALFAAAETFANYSLRAGSSSTRRSMDDASLLTHWETWLETKNLGLPERQVPQLPTSTDPIRVFLCPPLSNVLEEEKRAIDFLLNEITKCLRGSGVAVEIEIPTMQSGGRQEHGPEIYLNRLARLRHTDLAIPLLDPPSTGVGIMLQLFHNATIPCLCATKNWAAVSRMVRGIAPFQLAHVEYSSANSLGPDIANWLTHHADEIRQSRAYRARAWELVRGLDIRRAMRLAQIVQADVSEMPLLREEFLDQLISNHEMIGTLTLLQLAYLVTAQKWSLVRSPSNFLALEPSFEELSANARNKEMAIAGARASLMTLWEALEDLGPTIDESKASREWSKYLDELSLDAAREGKRVRTVEDLTRSKKQWRQVLLAKEEL